MVGSELFMVLQSLTAARCQRGAALSRRFKLHKGSAIAHHTSSVMPVAYTWKGTLSSGCVISYPLFSSIGV
jgi:hypothetical protein